jgi:hypothetical protein
MAIDQLRNHVQQRKPDNRNANTDCRRGARRSAGGPRRTRRPGPDQGSQRRGWSADRRPRRRPHGLADGARRLGSHRVRGCRIRRGPCRTRFDLLCADQHPQPARGFSGRTHVQCCRRLVHPGADLGRTRRGDQPQRFHPAGPCPPRDACHRRRPAPGHRQRVSSSPRRATARSPWTRSTPSP